MAISEARSLLGFTDRETLTKEMIDKAFRQKISVLHPDQVPNLFENDKVQEDREKLELARDALKEEIENLNPPLSFFLLLVGAVIANPLLVLSLICAQMAIAILLVLFLKVIKILVELLCGIEMVKQSKIGSFLGAISDLICQILVGLNNDQSEKNEEELHRLRQFNGVISCTSHIIFIMFLFSYGPVLSLLLLIPGELNNAITDLSVFIPWKILDTIKTDCQIMYKKIIVDNLKLISDFVKKFKKIENIPVDISSLYPVFKHWYGGDGAVNKYNIIFAQRPILKIEAAPATALVPVGGLDSDVSVPVPDRPN